jgi:hypothetical protein
VNLRPTGLSIATFVAFLCTGNVTGQEVTPLLTIDDITTRIGTDVDARHVFDAILTHAMRQSHREFFLASQIRKEWLPAIPNVEFVRLGNTDIPEHLAGCGSYWIINRVARAGNVVSVRLSARCGCATLDYVVSFDGDDWRLGSPGTDKERGRAPGIGSGCAGPPPGCRCIRDVNEGPRRAE